MTGSTQSTPYLSPGPIRLPPGNLEPVEEHLGDSDIEDERSEVTDFMSEPPLSNIDEEDEFDDDLEDDGSMLERDHVFDKIKETISKSQQRSESVASMLSSISDSSDSPHVQISENYTSLAYGIQPKATYEHSGQHADIMGVAYNGRMRQFVILDSKGITTWKRDMVDPRDIKHTQTKELSPKTFKLNQVRRALQYPKYEYRLIMHVVYAPKYNCYFALGKDFSVKVLNRDFEETCSVNTDMRSVLYILFNPVKDELITGGVGGIKIWLFQQAAGKVFTELKPLANYELRLKETLPNVGGSWVKKVELDYHLQHLYCCSDTDLHVYDLSGKLLYNFERAHTMSITGACFSPSAKVLVTSSVDSEVKVWSLNGGLVHTFRGHSRAVTSLLLHPESSSILITSSLDGSIRMWSLETMDLLYMIVVSADGVMWMGLTDDKLLYISTCRNITLWHLNNFYCFWALARNQVSNLSLASCEEKTTRILAVGDDSSVRIFCRSNHKNITTVLPPPDISPLQKVLSVCYSREKNAAFLLITNKEIWVYTTRTDPSSRIAIWDIHDLQLPYISGDTSNLPPGVIIQPPSQSVTTHRATENGNGNEIISNCCSLCILNSTAMMMTDEGLCCPIRHTYLLLGMEDGRILFMDPVIKGQKYMEFKASKDAIQEMRHDVGHRCLITLCRLKTLVLIQIWGLPQLDAMYEFYCGPDVTCYARVGLSVLTGHTSGQVNLHPLEPVEDYGITKPKQQPSYENVVDEKRRPEHHGPIVAMDSLTSLQVFVTCSSDGGIKVWDENKVLLTEVMLEDSLSSACFLNDMGDLLVAFKNHIFFIDHTKLCPTFKPPEIEMETSDQESDVYEDPRVLYEMLREDDESVTLENYLVPYDHLEFDKDFLEGKTKIEQPKTAAEAMESSESETETDISLAPSSIYMSPAESIESLSMIDLTLGADYSKYDLRDQMKATLDYMGTRANEVDKWKNLPPARLFLKLRKIQIANAKTSKHVYRKKHRGRKRHKGVSIETPAQSDMEDKEIEMEMEKFSLPMFGDSPGGSPSMTPPSGQASPRRDRGEEDEDWSDEEIIQKRPSGFVPIRPDQALSSESSDHCSISSKQSHRSESVPESLSPSSPTQSHTPTPVKYHTKQTITKLSMTDKHDTTNNSSETKEVCTTQPKLPKNTPRSPKNLHIGNNRTIDISPTSDGIDDENQSEDIEPISVNEDESIAVPDEDLDLRSEAESDKALVFDSKSETSSTLSVSGEEQGIEIQDAYLLANKDLSHSIKLSRNASEESINSISKQKLFDKAVETAGDLSKHVVSGKQGDEEKSNLQVPEVKSTESADDSSQTNSSTDSLVRNGNSGKTKSTTVLKRNTIAMVSEKTNKKRTQGHIAKKNTTRDEIKSVSEFDVQSNVDSGRATSAATCRTKTTDNDSANTADNLKNASHPDEELTSKSNEFKNDLHDDDDLTNEADSLKNDLHLDKELANKDEGNENNLYPDAKVTKFVSETSSVNDKEDANNASPAEEPQTAGTPASKVEQPKAGYAEEDEQETGSRRMKGIKVDVREMMKKRRITSGRAPSLTRRSSADHAHDEHDHDHDHGHDDKRSKKDLKKKQQMDNRKLPPDKAKILNLPPNPPSMLSRKRSLSEQRKSLELNLIHRPDIHKTLDTTDASMAHLHMDNDNEDADLLQEEQWATEAAIHGQTLTLPPQKDKNRARTSVKIDQRLQRGRDHKFAFDDRKNSVEGLTPGVGSSPTAELEKEHPLADGEKAIKIDEKKEKIIPKQLKEVVDQADYRTEDEDNEVLNLDANTPETQMQRAKRLGLKLDSDKVFENDKNGKSFTLPKVSVRRSKLNVYIPQAERERESISSARSSRRGTPDSGIEDSISTQGLQTPRTPKVKITGDFDHNVGTTTDGLSAHDDTLLSERDILDAMRRPASSFTGLRRGTLEGERLNADRPHTAHVRFKAEMEELELEFIVELPDRLDDLQSAFEEALRKYQNLPGTPSAVTADTLYKNDGLNFEENWQERAIERHILLRMQKEIRAQSAAQRRQAHEMIQKDKQSSKLFTSRCDSAIGGFTDRDSSIQTVQRANTSMSVPISLGYGVGTAPPSSRGESQRPKTANPVLEKQAAKSDLSNEKAYRYRLNRSGPSTSRPPSSKSISSVNDFSPHWIDPRNPDAWRPKSSRSIPSKCNRYILVNKPKEKHQKPVPSPLEEQLLIERFPKLGAKVTQAMPDLTPRMKKSYNLEYSPFVYQRYV